MKAEQPEPPRPKLSRTLRTCLTRLVVRLSRRRLPACRPCWQRMYRPL